MKQELREFLEGKRDQFTGDILFDEPLARHTYYRIGGPARTLAVPKTLQDLHILADAIRACQVDVFVLGLGSNLLVSDEGYSGLVVKAGRISLEISEEKGGEGPDTLRLKTGASVAVSSLLRRASQEGWAGLEFLAGVPGSIGGVVTMNAGTHLGEAKDRLVGVTYFPLYQNPGEELPGGEPDADGLITATQRDFRYEYRKNLFLPEGAIVISARWEVTRGEPKEVKAAIDQVLTRRKSTQPVEYPSCGSVFKNPRAHGLHAWQVMDRLGLRGHRIGAAQFSEKHSNFIINLGGAKATDVRGLIELAKSRAKAELGVELEEEVKYVGKFSRKVHP